MIGVIRQKTEGRILKNKKNISIIIPTLNEEKNIKTCIESAKRLNPFEIIVVDGGSTDRTREIASETGVLVLESPKGRGAQMNKGASVAKGDILLFLHADAQLLSGLSFQAEQSNLESLYEIASHPSDVRNHGLINKNYIGGFFRLRFDDNSISTRLVEFFANLRARLFSLPYGDQAIFIRKDIFQKIGGFKEYPFLEDIDIVLRMRKAGRLRYVKHDVVVSSRRIKKGYPLSPILISSRNVMIALLFLLGVRPQRLVALYK